MPTDVDPGMAFMLVQHLAPDHKSMLAELIRRYTRMQVFEVEDGMEVHPNCAYIIPPNHDMALLNGRLQLLEPTAPRGQRLPIDFFFRSLAQDQHERAIGIVLSGTGSDGTLGVRAIKGAAGMVMAQAPETTEFDGMPRSAIATGLVDYALAPGEMPARLMTYVAHAFGKLPRMASQAAPLTAGALNKIFVLLRAQTGHDFSQYKPTTIHRRIERRMAVHQITALDGYVKYLQQTPAEVQALFRDLLIGVTNFFRDPEAFAVLEQAAIPRLFDDKPPGGVVRVWVAGCSTGEEAYSIAILLQERMEMLKTSWTVQVFATDIDSRAIATARVGLYPASIATDLTPERLARFFCAEPGGQSYRIHKSIRDMLVFSEQDVIKDPPFSRLDLISCRNLLIYLDVELQKRLIPLFHYALKPGGPVSGHLRRHRRVRRPVCRARPQGQAVPAQAGLRRRAARAAGARVVIDGPPDPLRCGAAAFPRQARPGREAAAARTDRAGPAAPDRTGRRAGQRRRRHPLPARAHRPVPGAGARRGRRQQHPEDGARGPAPRPDRGPAQGRFHARAGAGDGPARQDQRPRCPRQPRRPSDQRAAGPRWSRRMAATDLYLVVLEEAPARCRRRARWSRYAVDAGPARARPTPASRR
jgi:chemotaxis methyl-accepting protein methylase